MVWKSAGGCSEKTEAPVIGLSKRNSELDRVLGLDAGLDDYLGKPYGPRELVARIQAVLRRSGPRERANQTMAVGPLHLNLRAREVRVHDRLVVLTRIEFDLLAVHTVLGVGFQLGRA